MKEAPEGPGEGGVREATLWSECVSWGGQEIWSRGKSQNPCGSMGQFP